MKRLILLCIVFFLVFSLPYPVAAETVEDIKAMMEQMKADYDARVKELEAKIESLSVQQQKDSAKIEAKSKPPK